MSGINDPLNWDLLKRETYTAKLLPNGAIYTPVPPISLVSDSYLLQIGFRNSQAKSHWRFAANVDMRLLTLPSSTSEFMASVAAFRKSCMLNELTLIQFPDWGVIPFLVEIRVGRWHKEMLIEAWKYSGDPVDFPTQSLESLNRIELKIDNL